MISRKILPMNVIANEKNNWSSKDFDTSSQSFRPNCEIFCLEWCAPVAPVGEKTRQTLIFPSGKLANKRGAFQKKKL